MRRIALIACVKEKANRADKAINLYIGEDFKFWLDDATHRQHVDDVYILSGKYGLLETDQVIEPYDLNLNHQSEDYRIRWASNIIAELGKRTDLIEDHFFIYTNETYFKGIIPHLNHYTIPVTIE